MSDVNVFVVTTTDKPRVRCTNEKLLAKVSDFARSALANQTGQIKNLEIRGAAPGAVRFVLEQALKSGNNAVYIIVKKQPIKHVVTILQAVDVLQIRPAQPHIEGHIVHHVAKEKIKAEEMIAIHQYCGRLCENSKPWLVMVDQLAWALFKEGNKTTHTLEDITALMTEAAKYRDLFDAIQAKHAELVEKKINDSAVKEAKKRDWQQLKENWERAQARTERIKAQAARAGEDRRRDAEFWRQEKAGERPVSEGTVSYIMQKKGGYWVKDLTRATKGKKAEGAGEAEGKQDEKLE